MKQLIWSRFLLAAGIVILGCYLAGLIYFYNFREYNPYASAGADVDALIHSALFLPPAIICLLLSLVLRISHKKSSS